MTIEEWLQAALADADRRGLPGLKPVLQALAGATKALRAADFNDDARGNQRTRQSTLDTQQSQQSQ